MLSSLLLLPFLLLSETGVESDAAESMRGVGSVLSNPILVGETTGFSDARNITSIDQYLAFFSGYGDDDYYLFFPNMIGYYAFEFVSSKTADVSVYGILSGSYQLLNTYSVDGTNSNSGRDHVYFFDGTTYTGFAYKVQST